jgi:uncharacterized oxidoreductase
MSAASKSVLVPVDSLRAYLKELYQAYGATAEDAAEVAEHLLEASLSGHDSHGIMRTPEYIGRVQSGEIDPSAHARVVTEGPAWAAVDAGWGFGQPASRFAMQLAIRKARQAGIACVTVRNGNHMGRVGYYTQMAAAEGMFGLGCVNINGAPPLVAAFGGIDRRLGTNPFSISFPSGREPAFMADFATSVVAEGKIRWYRNNEKQTPEGCLVSDTGEPTTDPWELYREPLAAMLPLGGFVGNKGYALCVAIEALAGGLSGGGCANPDGGRHGNACWYVAIDIAAFTPYAEFVEKATKMLDYMKTSRPRPGIGEVLYPGEPEYRSKVRRLAEGVPVDAVTLQEMAKYARAKGLVPPPALA